MFRLPVLLGVAVLVGVVVLLVTLLVLCVRGPVARARVERFARRQLLEISPTNGNQVITYLATTRRWRVAGLVAGTAFSVAWSLRNDAIQLNFLTLFAGWFAGALIAEARAVQLAPARRRAASLEPRRPAAYLGWFSWWLLPATVAVAMAATVGSIIIDTAAGRSLLPVLAWFGLASAIAVVVRATQVRVLRRAQPLAQADAIAADDAIRSRSLHVLAGGGAALVLYCVTGELASLRLSQDHPAFDAVAIINGLGVFLIPALGWNVATARWRVRRAPPAVPATA